jgi:histone H3/H4
MITVRTQIKDFLREEGLDNMSADFLDTLDVKVKQILKDAIKRAKENGRRTVMSKDL